jgi:hypothetical protein
VVNTGAEFMDTFRVFFVLCLVFFFYESMKAGKVYSWTRTFFALMWGMSLYVLAAWITR